MKKSLSNILGPGLLFAGAAIGVSHLVQATRAGADFGFGLLWALLIVSLFKYPFFQFGPRYAAATGETLLDGYKKLGKGVLLCYFILNFATMFTIQAAVTIVTASLGATIFGFTSDLIIWSVLILGISMLLLSVGKYKLLDNLMKYIIFILTISTIISVIVALFSTQKGFNFQQILPSGTAQITFLIAFLGWMPAPLDVSIWHSLWSVEKSKTTFQQIKPKHAIFDFNVGYIATFFLGVCFVILGALVMYQSGETFSNKGTVFAKQLIHLYTKNLGDFSYLFIGIAAFTTMFSTTLTTLDASPRAMTKTSELLSEALFNKKNKLNYWFWMLFLTAGTFVILSYFLSDMGFLVKIATVLSFLTAPFYAILNYILITGKHTPVKNRPKLPLRILSILGIIFLLAFSIWFLMNL
ncbi:Nramp family divalent metal transporter [Tenacibaculum piscium]|uniref:Iron transporter n=2 Tax=Tenacibaculum piscium TaxID=1458515 RepID=A0A2H1YGB8_9FLAO|nr:Nramp family divalent metal transporter [Tenacibaculum piscium]MBE7629551.1 divalent metal cation transporter [Tenacibaculum piscium]MBE7670734.1 divalent metal cation transporter [Tenacibaculum piscium]MBE7685195.1 divalent metal cation transporter [Tenacibaculum piscium]SOS74536.1 Iron transporter [Tenacibaculum piscium]